jgi:hypothetical protein
MLPVALLPVGVVATVLARPDARWAAARPPARFALAWVVPGVAVLSSFGSKQIHYLMPLSPALAILAAGRCGTRSRAAGTPRCRPVRCCSRGRSADRRATPADGSHLPQWLSESVPPLGSGAAGRERFCWPSSKEGRRQVVALSPHLSSAAHRHPYRGGGSTRTAATTSRPVAALLKAGEQAGRPIASWDRTQDSSTSSGDFDRPFEETTHDSLARGRPVTRSGSWCGWWGPPSRGGALISRPYGQYVVAVWSASRLPAEE